GREHDPADPRRPGRQERTQVPEPVSGPAYNDLRAAGVGPPLSFSREVPRMAGVNPYIAKVNAPRPVKPFKLTVVVEETGERTELVVDPAKIPYGRIGLEGSILDLATG